MKFNEKLKSIREVKGYTQDEIASKLNIARQSVSKWEQGINEPDFETVKKLCVILDCGINELLDDDQEIVLSKDAKKEKTARTLMQIGIISSIFSALFVLAFFVMAQGEVIAHWGTSGITYGHKANLLIMLVLVALGVLVEILLHLLASKNSLYRAKRLPLQIVGFCSGVALDVLAIVFVVLMANRAIPLDDYANLPVVLLFAFLCSIGLFMHPRFNKRNILFGFRTNFTLSNQEGWDKVNAFAAIILTAFSIVGYALTLIFVAEKWALAFIALLAPALIICFVYHEIVKKKLRDKQENQ